MVNATRYNPIFTKLFFGGNSATLICTSLKPIQHYNISTDISSAISDVFGLSHNHEGRLVWLLLYAHKHRSIHVLGAAGHIILTPANQLMVMGLKL
jgi:hypothetical protein